MMNSVVSLTLSMSVLTISYIPNGMTRCKIYIFFIVYCIQMVSRPDSYYYPYISPPCEVKGHFNATDSDVRGGRISLIQNGVSKAIIPAGFEKFKY